MHNKILVFNKYEWLMDKTMFNWTAEEINNADEKGLIGTKYGVDCYVTKPIRVIS